MDMKYKNEFEFLDLSGLDDRTRGEISVALNSGAATEVLQLPWDTGEDNYDYEADIVQMEPVDQAQNWPNYDPEQSQISYEPDMDATAAVISTMQPPHVYAHPQPQITTAVYPSMVMTQPNMFVNEMGQEVGMHTYVQGVDFYQQPYIQGPEMHEVAMSRDNRRRGHRVRGSKREANNRYMEPDMAPAYHPGQAQYQRIPRNTYSQTIYYQTPDHHQNTQRQRPYYGTTPALYSQPISHPVYPQVCHPQSGGQYRHAPVAQVPRQRPEPSKHLVKRGGDLPAPRPTGSNYGAPPISIQRKSENVNSTQTNIDCVTTVIVNNSKIERSGEGAESTPNSTQFLSNNNKINNSDSNSNFSNSSSSINNDNKVPPVNVTIEHNIVATVNNKNCELLEKNDVPYVNINSSIQVKQKNEQNNVELRKETVSLVQTSLPEPEPEPEPEPVVVAVAVVEEEPKEEKAETVVPEPVVVAETPEPEIVAPQAPITPTARAAPEASMSWASILKKTSTEGVPNGKPTARINPLRIDVESEVANKFHSSPNEAPGTRQAQGKPRAFSNTDNSGNESTASNQNEPQEEYNSSNKFDDLDAYKTGEFLLKYQMEKQTVSLLPRGLINRNNYCYINSILQALLACPPFYNLLVSLPYSRSTSRSTSNNLTTNMIRFVHEFSPLSAGARLPRKDRAQKRSDEAVINVQSGIAFEPSYVYTMLKNTSCASVFSVEGRQEDAEEFLSCLLNGISDEMLEMMKLANNEDTPETAESEPVQPNHGGDQEEWKIMGPKNKGSITRCTDFGRTPLSDIFRGQLRYRVSRAGEQPTDNVQPFFTLQLDIEKAESVKGALEILVGRDQLEGMTCSKTKREIEAWKQVTLEELPVILILHLKWFDYKLDGCSKILKSVEFPIDLKIDSKILSTNASKKLSAKQKQYKLFAVTYHDGKEATKGHYVTDAFHVGYGGWVRYDDSSLRGVPEQNVLNPLPPRVPYLLYYRRCDTIGNNQLNSENRIR